MNKKKFDRARDLFVEFGAGVDRNVQETLDFDN